MRKYSSALRTSRIILAVMISAVTVLSASPRSWAATKYPYEIPVPVEAYWAAWAHAKSCEDQNAFRLSPMEIVRKVKLSRLPPETLAWHAPSKFRQLKCWKPKKEADFTIKLPTNAGVTGAYAGKNIVPADPIADNFIVAPLRLYDENTTTLKANAYQPVIDFLMRAAKANALSKNNRVPWGRHPMDFPVMQAVFQIVVAYAAVYDELSTEQKRVIHAWLSPLVETALNSSWVGPDFKALFRDSLGAFWGRITGDRALVERAKISYQFHIDFMRKDGTFGFPSSRGGSAGHYTISATAALIFIASMDAMDGGNLFSYSKDGRSIHDSVRYLLDFSEDPVGVNARYAKQCTGSSMGTMTHPAVELLESDVVSGFSFTAMRLYAVFNPDHRNTKRWRKVLPNQSQPYAVWDTVYGSFACYLAGTTPKWE